MKSQQMLFEFMLIGFLSFYSVFALVSIEFGYAPHFLPSRLEVVALKQDTYGFAADPWHQFSFDHLFCYQSNGPASMPLGWLTADRGDDALFLHIVQEFAGAGPLLLKESPMQTALPERWAIFRTA